MEKPAKLPLDVLGYIADVLGADRKRPTDWRMKDLSRVDALKKLSLTCKFMVPICRRHLFANIIFSFSGERTGLSEFLLSHPIIATHYAKSLDLDARPPLSTLDYGLLRTMADSSSLTSIEISSADWNALPDEKRSAFLSLIKVPTLRHLTLERIVNFPASAFSLCCGLTTLALYEIYHLAPPGTNDGMQSPKITTLISFHHSDRDKYNDSLATLMSPVGRDTASAAGSIIVFDHLKKVSLKISTPAEFSRLCKLLERAVDLERLRICVNNSEETPLAGLGASLAANPQPKLRSMELDLGSTYQEGGDDILDGLNLELRQISGKNTLEVLQLDIEAELDGLCSPDWTAWAADFDQLLTDIGAFPALRKVIVRLAFTFPRELVPDSRFEDHPWNLAEESFALLLESSAIDFKIWSDI